MHLLPTTSQAGAPQTSVQHLAASLLSAASSPGFLVGSKGIPRAQADCGRQLGSCKLLHQSLQSASLARLLVVGARMPPSRCNTMEGKPLSDGAVPFAGLVSKHHNGFWDEDKFPVSDFAFINVLQHAHVLTWLYLGTRVTCKRNEVFSWLRWEGWAVAQILHC